MSAAPNCMCGLPSKHLQTRKDNANKGRWFFSCSSGGCKHFAWDDATPRDQTWSPYAAAAPAPGYAAQAPSASGETNRPIYDASARGRGGYSNRGRGGGSGGPQGGAARPWGSGPGHGAASPAKAFNPSAVPVEVIFSIFDSDRIGVKFPINDTVNRWLRDRLGQGGMRWDSDTKLWIFDQSKYEEIANAMEDELSDRVNISITRIPKFAYSLYKRGRERMVINPEERERINQSMARNLPKDLFETLLPFQRAGVRKAIENEGRVFICDEMGLGKTIQALSVLAFYRPQWPALIICPSSLRYTWKNEIKRWLKLEDDDIQVITTGKDRIDDRKRMTIISYDLAAKTEISNELTNLAFDCVVADESHNLKSKDSKRTMAITPLLQQAKRAILLSGTPALSRPIELYPQLACLKPDLFTSFSAFGDRYCDPRPARFSRGMEYKGSSYLTELHWILDKTVLVRRLKKDVLKELPEKRRQCIMVEVPASNREALSKKLGDLQRLEEMKRGMAGRGGNDGKIRGIESQCRALYTELYTLTGSAKLPAVTEYLEEIYKSDEHLKIIVFGHHKEVLDGICAFVSNRLKSDYIRIDGGTAQKDRQMLCDQFQNNPDTRIAVLSIRAAGVGLTLNKADFVIFAELYWNPGDLLQGEDRAHRIGREGPVAVKYIIAGNSLDDRQWPLIRRKLEVVGRSVDGNSKDINIEETDGSQQKHRQATNRAAKDQATITNFFRPDGEEGPTGERFIDPHEPEDIVDDDLERMMDDLGAADIADLTRDEDMDEIEEERGGQSHARREGRKHDRAESSDEESPTRTRTTKRLSSGPGSDGLGRHLPGGSAPPDLPLRRNPGLENSDGGRSAGGGSGSARRPPRDPTLSESEDDGPVPLETILAAPQKGQSRGMGSAPGVRNSVSSNFSRASTGPVSTATYIKPMAMMPPKAAPLSPKAPQAAVQSNATVIDDGGDRDSFFGDDDEMFMEEALAMAHQIELGL